MTLVARVFWLCWVEFIKPPISHDSLRRNDRVAAHATIRPNVGDAVMVPRHCICVFGGVQAHAIFVYLFGATFWFPADTISIF
jgi:hypothetical protein